MAEEQSKQLGARKGALGELASTKRANCKVKLRTETANETWRRSSELFAVSFFRRP